MKWRNQLLALICLLAFAGLGVIYFQHWVIRKPFGIILFVGEGLSPARLAPTRTYAAGAGTRLNLASMPLHALGCGFDAVRCSGNKLFKRFCCPCPGSRRNCDCNR